MTDPSTYKKKMPQYSMTARNELPSDSTRKPGPGAHRPEQVLSPFYPLLYPVFSGDCEQENPTKIHLRCQTLGIRWHLCRSRKRIKKCNCRTTFLNSSSHVATNVSFTLFYKTIYIFVTRIDQFKILCGGYGRGSRRLAFHFSTQF